jgi:hypothetical protein
VLGDTLSSGVNVAVQVSLNTDPVPKDHAQASAEAPKWFIQGNPLSLGGLKELLANHSCAQGSGCADPMGIWLRLKGKG